MNAILIPVKEFREAKKRLAPHFPLAARAALAEAMCRDFFSVVAEVRSVDRVFVISKEARALEWGRRIGWETIPESQQKSESESVDTASRYCAERGVEGLLRLPIDIPIAEAQDIEAIFSAMDSPRSAVIVPSRDGTGTNALLRKPPNLFPSRFGPNSFALHIAEAERRGVCACVFRNARLELDVDQMDDIASVAARLRPGSATAQWFKEQGILPSRSILRGGREEMQAAAASGKALKSAGR